MAMGLFNSSKELDHTHLEAELSSLFSQIIVPEFGKDIVSLGCYKGIELKDNTLHIRLVLPTFALASEAEVAIAVKRTALEKVPSSMKVELNVYADVRPVVAQSILREGIADVKNILLVASGKGGVGKSTVASNLAVALSQLGARVGLLDADVYGPSIPLMLGVSTDEPVQGIENEVKGQPPWMLPLERHGIKLMSLGFLVDTQTAMVWRGPMIASACMQMFMNVAWGDLDYLIVDLPPGTGDIQLTIAQKVSVAGAIIVSTPQDVALADVIRAKSMFDKVNISVLGVVENMSYFICDGCDKRHEIFTHGGAHQAADRLGLPFLTELPLEPKVRAGGDEGTPVVIKAPESSTAKAFKTLAHQVATSLVKQIIENGEAVAKKIADPQAPSARPASASKGLPVIM